MNILKKLFIQLIVLAMVFSFIPLQSKALTYDQIKNSQSGQVLGEGTFYPYPSGSLINDSGTIYFISGTTKVPFTSWQAFIGLGYSLRNVINGNLQNYTPSTTYFITTANADHPWGSWLLYNGTVYYSTEAGLIGVPNYDIFVNNGGDWKYVVKANKYDVAVLNSNRSLSLLATGDSRIYGQPVSFVPAFSNQPNQTVPPVSITPTLPASQQNQSTGQQQNNTNQNQATQNNASATTTNPTLATSTPAAITASTTPQIILGLTSSQSDIIKKDLQTIKSLGFKRVRVITYVQYPGDPAYTTWPANVFITFPKPKDSELTNLKQYLQLVDKAGLQYEFVLLMPDSKNKYYTNGITGQDYKNFIDAIWPDMWAGKLDSIEVGGDLTLNPPTIDTQNPDSFPTGQNVVNSNRQWLLEMWPYLNAKCPGCNLGVEVLTGYAKFWDMGAQNLTWVKANLTPQPKFVGVQYYPTTPDALTRLGFRQGTTIDWNAAIQDWYTNLKMAAGTIPVIADEIGLDLNMGYTAQDQVNFYQATASYLVQNGVHFNVWEFADHPGIGLLGLMDQNRVTRPVATTLQNIITPTASTALTVGIQYNPPEFVGWQFIMPQN